MSKRDRWRRVLAAEVKRWYAKSVPELIEALSGTVEAYEIEADSTVYQVEVQMFENTPQYVHVMVSVDDGVMPGAMFPVGDTFLLHKDPAAATARSTPAESPRPA